MKSVTPRLVAPHSYSTRSPARTYPVCCPHRDPEVLGQDSERQPSVRSLPFQVCDFFSRQFAQRGSAQNLAIRPGIRQTRPDSFCDQGSLELPQRPASQEVVEGLPINHFHRNESYSVSLIDFVDCADVGMIEG